MDDIKSIIINKVEIQENGIIRDRDGLMLGRLRDNLDYKDIITHQQEKTNEATNPTPL